MKWEGEGNSIANKNALGKRHIATVSPAVSRGHTLLEWCMQAWHRARGRSTDQSLQIHLDLQVANCRTFGSGVGNLEEIRRYFGKTSVGSFPLSPRWLFGVIVSVLGVASASAQPATVVPNQGFAPVVVNNIGGPDPYAMVGPPPASSWWNNGIVLPTTATFRDRLWIRLDYLFWGTEGMDIPALVTTSPTQPLTPAGQAGVLGEPGTSVLFGGREINDGSVSGARLSSGFWFRNGAFGIEGEIFQLRKQDDGYAASSDGTTILARPFFDVMNGQENSRLVSYPGMASGSVAVTSQSDLRSFLINGRAALVPVCNGVFEGQDSPPDRIDWIVGYRQLELRDQLTISDNVTSLDINNPGSQSFVDSFATKNKFSGLQLGVVYRANFRRAWMESLLRVAVGENRQTIQISGSTTSNGATSNTGLLTQQSNIGNFDRKEFTMIPELGLNFGFRITSCLHATLGYNVVYFPGVVRAGDQIDTDINTTAASPHRPRVLFAESDYWAQGINLGAELAF